MSVYWKAIEVHGAGNCREPTSERRAVLRYTIAAVLLALGFAAPVCAQNYADEATDWGIAPTSELLRNNALLHSKTPTTVPGARTITTDDLETMKMQFNPFLLFDVLAGTSRKVIPGAILLGFDAGDGNVFAAEKARFAKVLAKLTGGNKTTPMVFYCLGAQCWLSYNASLRAVKEGYTDVMWYRGGIEAWLAARQKLVPAEPYRW